jgi:hypothetical protein
MFRRRLAHVRRNMCALLKVLFEVRMMEPFSGLGTDGLAYCSATYPSARLVPALPCVIARARIGSRFR